MNYTVFSQDTYPRCHTVKDCLSYCRRRLGIPFCVRHHCFCLRISEEKAALAPSPIAKAFKTNGFTFQQEKDKP